MQAILTKFIPATNKRPNRIKAYCPAGSVTICSDNIPFASHDERSHRLAAQQLAGNLGWNQPMIGGSTPDNNYCFVLFPAQLTNKFNQDEFEIKQILSEYYK